MKAAGLQGSPPAAGVNQSAPVRQAPTGGTDRLVNNDTGASGTAYFTQSETSQVVFGNTVVAGFNDSGSNSGGTNQFTGWSRSTDGGQTWVDGGALPASAAGDAGDPQLARDTVSGRIYFATLGYSNEDVIQVFHSDDNGQTWSAPLNGAPGRQSLDKHWLTVDNFSGTGQGDVYLVVRDFGAGNGIYFFRSTDHGATFGPSGGTLIASGASANVQGANVVVAPDHSVYAFWYDSASSSIKVRKSTDLGLTFASAVTVASGLIGGTNGDLGLTGVRNGTATASAFRTNEFPQAAVNPSNGDVYVTFDNKGAGSDKADVFLVQSTDGGATWSAATKVNDDATTTDQWGPTLAVMPNGSSLGVFYYSRQEDTANNNLFKFYGRIATISGHTVTFGTGFPVSDVASLPEFGRDNVVNSTYMGDYDLAVATANGFHVIWADNRDDLAGGSPRKDPNVYYDSILSPGTITVTKQLISSAGDPAKFNLRIDGTTYAANVGNGGTTGAVTVSSGTHTVSETAGTNANLANYSTSISCSDGSSGTGTSLSGVQVNPGDNVTCTITNSGGTITVTKHLVSFSNDPAKFNLRIDGTTYAANVGNGGTTGAVKVAAGTHTVSETAGTNSNLGNYTPRIECSDGSANYGTSLSGVQVNAGGNVTCTITNTRKLFKAP